jgi:hypothetical protein
MYVIVYAKEGSGERPVVYKGTDLPNLLYRVRTKLVGKRSGNVGWTWPMDDFVRENQNKYSRRELAALLTEQFGRNVTKSAVCGRVHYLRGRNVTQRAHQEQK